MSRFLRLYSKYLPRYVDRGAPGRGKRSISVLLAHWVYDKKLLVGTQFLFKTLMFTVGEDGNLEMQVRGPPLRQWAPIYNTSPYSPHRSFIHNNFSIGWCLLRFESLCRAVHSRCYEVMGRPNRGAYFPTLSWDIKLHFIGRIYRSGLQ
jgi:hypothetical protein